MAYGQKNIDKEPYSQSILCLEKTLSIQLVARECDFSHFLTIQQAGESLLSPSEHSKTTGRAQRAGKRFEGKQAEKGKSVTGTGAFSVLGSGCWAEVGNALLSS